MQIRGFNIQMWVLVLKKFNLCFFQARLDKARCQQQQRQAEQDRTTTTDFLFLCRMYRINEEKNKTEKLHMYCFYFLNKGFPKVL